MGEILAEVRLSKPMMTVAPHAQLQLIMCVHGASVEDDRHSSLKVETGIFFPQVPMYKARLKLRPSD